MLHLKSVAILATMAGLLLTAAEAASETVGTACLSSATGEVYALAPYRSTPSRKCRDGDETVRFALHQPNTAFAKRSSTVAEDASVEVAHFDEDNLVVALRSGDESREGGNCELVIDDLVQATETLVASVPPGEWRDGLHEVTHIDHERLGPDGQSLVQTYQTNRLVLTDRNQAFVFHDILIDYRGLTCFAAFLVEFAPRLELLYDR